jgi:predicted nucleotidyltransferase
MRQLPHARSADLAFAIMRQSGHSVRVPALGEQRADREREAARACEVAAIWADEDSSLRAVGLAGSYARNAARADSDVDLVVLAIDPQRLLDDDAWHRRFGDVRLVRAERFGVLIERRLQLPSGLEIEVGIVSTSWASIDPVDAGTRKVVQDGFRILHDPDGHLKRLVETVGATP